MATFAGRARRVARDVISAAGLVLGRMLPPSVYASTRGRWRVLRTHRHLTAVLGPEFSRNPRLLEIDITYACNLNCYNCNRSCEQAPTGEHMDLAQIQAHVDEWIKRGKSWERVRLLGGEPTLHKQFFEILDVIRAYRDQHSPSTAIEVTTNGHGDKVNAAIGKIPPDVIVNNTSKASKVQPEFCSFNVAPVDLPDYRHTDYANACLVPQVCGTGLGPGGYYPCAVASGIDRIFRWRLGRPTMPDDGDPMRDDLRRFCAVCGYFKRAPEPPLEGPVRSATWDVAYANHRRGRATGGPRTGRQEVPHSAPPQTEALPRGDFSPADAHQPAHHL